MKLWIDRTGNATDFTLQSFPIIHRLSLGTDDQLIDGKHQDRVRALIYIAGWTVAHWSKVTCQGSQRKLEMVHAGI